MMKRATIAAISASILMVFGFSKSAFAQEAEPVPTGSSGIQVFTIDLTGDAEVPGPGAEGSGTAFIVVNPDDTQFCYDVQVSGIATPTAAHIHEGAAGESGDPVVPLEISEGARGGCVTGVDSEVLQRIADNPAGFYVNVHNDDFPQGALRGQLEAEQESGGASATDDQGD